MSRSQIRRIVTALALVAILASALPVYADSGSSARVTGSFLGAVVDQWTDFWNWVNGKRPDLPTQAQGRRNGPPETVPPDTDKGSGIDPNGGGGGGQGGH